MRYWIGLTLLLLMPRSVAGQQLCTPAPPFASPPPTAFTCYGALPIKLAFDSALAVSGDVFKVRLDGGQIGTDFPAVPGTTAVVLTLAGFPSRVAPYAVTVGHVRPPNAEVMSPAIALTLIPAPLPPPPAPGNLRIIAELLDAEGHVLARYTLMDRFPAVGQ